MNDEHISPQKKKNKKKVKERNKNEIVFYIVESQILVAFGENGGPSKWQPPKRSHLRS